VPLDPDSPDGHRSGGECRFAAAVDGSEAALDLSVVSSPARALIGTTFPIRLGEMVIGRDPGTDVQAQDGGVSRRHFRLVRGADGRCAVHDLGSTNGTFVNGARVQSALLSPGDRIQIGNGTEFTFELAAKARGEDEIRLRQALAVAGGGAWSWEVESGRLSFSGGIAGHQLTSGDLTELPLHDFWSRVDEKDRAALTSRLEQSAREGGPCQMECRIRRPDGSTVWVAMAGEVYRDPDGATRIAGTALDVTDRKQAELEMHRQSVLLDALSDGVVAIDHRGTILDWNARAEAMFGWSRAEVLGRAPGQILLAPDREDDLTPAILERARQGERFAEERALRRRDGREIAIEVVAVPLRDPGGHQIACVAVLRDVDERRRMLAQLQVAERLAALGTLAAGVAHEINNPLAFMLANLSWVRGRLAGSDTARAQDWPEVDAALADCEQGSERIRAIVQALRTHAAPDPRDGSGPVDVNSVLDFVLRVADPELRHRARVSRKLEPVPPVYATQAQLGQVLLNLLVNAAESIPAGAASESEISVATRLDPVSGSVLVEIADTGSGIASQDLARIFDPFFTRKPEGSGTGLGLFICHRIVTALGGHISAESTPGAGSVFRVALPALPQPTCCGPMGHDLD
jgi:PAS domain S-box-containing protein